MVLQVAFVAKLMSANRAPEFLLPVVPVGEMPTEVALLAEALVADRAVELEEAAVNRCLVKSKIVL